MEPKLKIDPTQFENIEDEVDWNFDDAYVEGAHEALSKDSPELVEVLKKHANQGSAKED